MVFQDLPSSPMRRNSFPWISPKGRGASRVSLKFFHDDGDEDLQPWFHVSKRQNSVCKEEEEEDEQEKVLEDPMTAVNSNVNDYDALEYADRLEMGLSREIVSDFVRPVRSVKKLERYNVLTSENMTEFRLLSDDFQFLLYARANVEGRCVDIWQYDPRDEDGPEFATARPAFVLHFNAGRTEWRLVQERCQCCQYSPKQLSCDRAGKQQVACVRHVQKKLGDGVSNIMEVRIPGFGCDGSPVVWCPKLGRADLGSPTSPTNSPGSRRSSFVGRSPSSPERSRRASCSDVVSTHASFRSECSSDGEATTLTTKLPVWNEEFQCLVLDFEGRSVMASPQNFQLANPEDPEQLLCQYGKIGPNTYGLDFKKPLSVIQAFGVSLSTMFQA